METLPGHGPGPRKSPRDRPRFGLAYKLMYSAFDNQRPEERVQCYEKALSCAGRMSARDLLELRAGFHAYLRSVGYKIMTDAGIPASTIERLEPKSRSEALAVLKRLADLYPDFFSRTGDLSNLVNTTWKPRNGTRRPLFWRRSRR